LIESFSLGRPNLGRWLSFQKYFHGCQGCFSRTTLGRWSTFFQYPKRVSYLGVVKSIIQIYYHPNSQNTLCHTCQRLNANIFQREVDLLSHTHELLKSATVTLFLFLLWQRAVIVINSLALAACFVTVVRATRPLCRKHSTNT
jgi:hypothetical protein